MEPRLVDFKVQCIQGVCRSCKGHTVNLYVLLYIKPITRNLALLICWGQEKGVKQTGIVFPYNQAGDNYLNGSVQTINGERIVHTCSVNQSKQCQSKELTTPSNNSEWPLFPKAATTVPKYITSTYYSIDYLAHTRNISPPPNIDHLVGKHWSVWYQSPFSCSLSIRAVVFFHCSILD